MSGELAGLLCFSIGSILCCGGENNNDMKSYASSKFIGGRGRFRLNAASCSLNLCASVINICGMFELYEGTSRAMLSWHACRSYRALIVAISTWLSYMSSGPEVILVAAQRTSTLGRALMFLSCPLVLSCHVLNVLSFLESKFLWLVFSLA
jgi:hypothetical protein